MKLLAFTLCFLSAQVTYAQALETQLVDLRTGQTVSTFQEAAKPSCREVLIPLGLEAGYHTCNEAFKNSISECPDPLSEDEIILYKGNKFRIVGMNTTCHYTIEQLSPLKRKISNLIRLDLAETSGCIVAADFEVCVGDKTTEGIVVGIQPDVKVILQSRLNRTILDVDPALLKIIR